MTDKQVVKKVLSEFLKVNVTAKPWELDIVQWGAEYALAFQISACEARLRQALGIASVIFPDLKYDVLDPVSSMQAVAKEVRKLERKIIDMNTGHFPCCGQLKTGQDSHHPSDGLGGSLLDP